MRPIDADAVKDVIAELNDNGYDISPSDLAFVRNILLRMPTVDAVPVVRCKDCKWWGLSSHNTLGIHICKKYNGVRFDSDYCSRAERSEDGETKQISAEFAKLMREGEIQVRWRDGET